MTNRRTQRGLSMIEILVTLVIVAVGALGLAGMQLMALKFNKEASVRSIATELTMELSDRMRLNIAGVSATKYDRSLGYTAALSTAVADPGCGKTQDCTSTTLAQLDLHDWLDAIATALPGGTGSVIPVAGNKSVYQLVVMWMEKSFLDSGGTDATCPTPRVVGVRCLSTTFTP